MSLLQHSFKKYPCWGHKDKVWTMLKVWIRRRMGYDALTPYTYQMRYSLYCKIRYLAEDTEYNHEELSQNRRALPHMKKVWQTLDSNVRYFLRFFFFW